MYRIDSRKILSGDIYICLPKGEGYIYDAVSRGAKAYMVMNRAQLSGFADYVYGAPSKKLCVIGVTGTNGKTSVASFVAQCLQELGCKPAVLGTLSSSLTTPESLDIQSLMATHVTNGGTHFVMEVSSHGIAQERVSNIDFDVKLLTNITQDHLDYHGDFESYSHTKLMFMRDYGGASVYPKDFNELNSFRHPSLIGTFNQENLKASLAILTTLGFDSNQVRECLLRCQPPPGRFETIQMGQPYTVIVDYAHTPDSLDNVLLEAKKIAHDRHGRLLTLFGCGGCRDRGKRSQMGQIATRYSDSIIVTQDNPRTEDPEQIIGDIKSGLNLIETPYDVIHDRRQAIYRLISMAKPMDVVMIAGKGHEAYQILAEGSIPFNDKDVASKAIKDYL